MVVTIFILIFAVEIVVLILEKVLKRHFIKFIPVNQHFFSKILVAFLIAFGVYAMFTSKIDSFSQRVILIIACGGLITANILFGEKK